MKNDKFHIYLDDDEYRQVVQCLILERCANGIF